MNRVPMMEKSNTVVRSVAPKAKKVGANDLTKTKKHGTSFLKLIASGQPAASKRETVGVKSVNNKLKPVKFHIAISNYKEAFPGTNFEIFTFAGNNAEGSAVQIRIHFSNVQLSDFGNTEKHDLRQPLTVTRTEGAWFGHTYKNTKGIEQNTAQSFPGVVARLICHYQENDKNTDYFVSHDCNTKISGGSYAFAI